MSALALSAGTSASTEATAPPVVGPVELDVDVEVEDLGEPWVWAMAAGAARTDIVAAPQIKIRIMSNSIRAKG